MSSLTQPLEMVSCPNCSTSVVVKENGECPACQHQIEESNSVFSIDDLSIESLCDLIVVARRGKEVVLYRSMYRPIVGFMIAAGLVGGAAWLGTLEGISDEAMLFIAAPMAVIALLIFCVCMVRLFDTAPKMRLDFEGITDYQERRPQKIFWDDVVRARYYEQTRDGWRECAVITLITRDNQDVRINVDGLNWSAEAIYGEIARRADLW